MDEMGGRIDRISFVNEAAMKEEEKSERSLNINNYFRKKFTLLQNLLNYYCC